MKMSEQRLRTQAAMVLQALERNIGDFIRDRVGSVNDLDPNMIATISNKYRGRSILSDDIDTIIEVAYLDDLWKLAREVSKDQGERSHLDKLQSIAEILNLYDIRNSVAHPNRPFPESYWWRMAAIATHENCELLQFSATQIAFQKANAGTLEDPPSEWLERLAWKLPNNLPRNSDFQETGLIGRRKEKEALKRLIQERRNRFIAIVAPGGIGKTALVLNVLNELALQPETSQLYSAICYVTLKTKQLTHSGLTTIHDYGDIENIQNEIFAALGQFMGGDSDVSPENGAPDVSAAPLLLCIDNAETILRDHSDYFLENVYDKLPDNVQVLATSRIQVDGARSFPLRAMELDQASLLARKYSDVRNLAYNDLQRFSSIAERAQRNPLAVRLIIDRIALQGADPSDAIMSTAKDIAEFSFSSLLDIMNSETILVLESIHTIGRMTAEEISIFLNINRDAVMAAVNQLVKTSIVARRELSEIEDSYEVNSSVEDFILVSEQNIAARQAVNQRLRHTERIGQEVTEVQEDRGVSEFHWYYIPMDTPPLLKTIARRSGVLRYGEIADIRQFHDELKTHADIFGEFSVYHAMIGKCFEKFGAHRQAEQHMEMACSLSGRKSRYIAMLGRFFHDREAFDRACGLYQELINLGMDDPAKSNDSFAATVIMGYHLALIFSHKYEEVIEITEDWRGKGKLKRMYGTFRADVVRRMSERSLPGDRVVAVRRSLGIFDEVIGGNEGETERWIKRLFLKAVQELIYTAGRGGEIEADLRADILESLEIAARHLSAGIGGEMKAQLASIDIERNPFAGLALEDAPRRVDDSLREEALREGFVELTITNIPHTEFPFPNYLFGRTEEERDYFCHFSNYEGDWEDWRKVKVGEQIMILPDEPRPGKATPPAKRIRICYV